jgi:hypothetical protein
MKVGRTIGTSQERSESEHLNDTPEERAGVDCSV